MTLAVCFGLLATLKTESVTHQKTPDDAACRKRVQTSTAERREIKILVAPSKAAPNVHGFYAYSTELCEKYECIPTKGLHVRRVLLQHCILQMIIL